MTRILAFVLETLSRATIRKYKPFIIGVTGSAGKTSAKEAIFSTLAAQGHIRKTSSNFNNELGLSLSILGEWSRIGRPVWFFWLRVCLVSLKRLVIRDGRYPRTLVLEYGSDKPGDIRKLLRIARPDIGVITAIGNIPVHVENYSGGVEAVFKEKSKIISVLTAVQTAILNADDPFYRKLRGRTRAKIISYGFSESADVRVMNFTHIAREERLEGIAFKIKFQNSLIPVAVRSAFSVSHAYAVACAVAVGIECGINPVDILDRMREYRPVEGRSLIREGIKRTQIIDESYNSSPLALETALKTLGMILNRRRIAVLGDMLELGDYTLGAHERAGEQAAKAVDVLVTVGPRAKFIGYKAREKGLAAEKIYTCETAEEAGRKLQELIREGDVVLIKGSHSIGLEKVVEEVREM